jgi:hypothetical protein
MTRRFLFATLVVALPALWMSACGGEDPFTPTTPTTTTIPTVATFSGVLGRNGATSYPFNTTASGSVRASITALSPDSALVIGFSLGTWNGAVCNIVFANDAATQGTVVNGTVSSFGSLCVRIYDVGNVTEPVSYEITVEHP